MIRRFNRFELKDVIPASVRDDLLDTLRAGVSPDPQGGAEGAYRVTSLYYDTRDLACFRAKLDGVKFRRKVRVRRYGGATGSPEAEVMVEIKQRINRTTQKRRIALTLREAYALCSGELKREWTDAGDAAVAGEVEFLALALQLRPACVIGYLRQAFVGSRYEPGLRITFDYGLWSSSASHGLAEGAMRYSILPPNWMVLEVKADHSIPLWVSNLLARHRVELSRFSKYCTGLKRLQALGRVSVEGCIEVDADRKESFPGGVSNG